MYYKLKKFKIMSEGETITTTPVIADGMLVNLVKQSPKEIREGRGEQALNDIHICFKQKVDAVFSKLNKLKNDMNNQLYKLIPNTTFSTSFDINPTEFVDSRTESVKELTNTELWYEALKKDYRKLFGKDYVEPESLLG